jgi:hypothetical protein
MLTDPLAVTRAQARSSRREADLVDEANAAHTTTAAWPNFSAGGTSQAAKEAPAISRQPSRFQQSATATHSDTSRANAPPCGTVRD